MGTFTMPSLGPDMEAGTIREWRVNPGDEVHRGDIVAVVETDKSTIEVEIFENGVVEELVVSEGERVPVGTVLAHLTTSTSRLPSTARKPHHAPRRAVQAARARTPRPAPEQVTETPAWVSAALTPMAVEASVHSPVIRHLAAELGVDLEKVAGSGAGGCVTRTDVERAAQTRDQRVPREIGRRTTGGRNAPSPGRPRAAAREGTATPGSSPLARRLATEFGVNMSELEGTGPGGSIVASDVRRAASTGRGVPETVAPTTELPVEGMATQPPSTAQRQESLRHAIGALMARSKREIPHYYLSSTIEVGAAVSWLEQANLERPVAKRLVLPALLVKATALAVAKVPEINGFFVDGVFRPSQAVHVGMAIALRGGGVIAPALHDVDQLNLDELMARLRDLVGRARSGVLRSSEMSDSTITVSNLGELGVDSVFGVIYPPQVALVGFGQVSDRAVAQNGMVGVRPCLTATLSADHRASDGHRGGRFLTEVGLLLQEPQQL